MERNTMAIVTTTYRYKPPPKRKGRKLAEITGPAASAPKRAAAMTREMISGQRPRLRSCCPERVARQQVNRPQRTTRPVTKP